LMPNPNRFASPAQCGACLVTAPADQQESARLQTTFKFSYRLYCANNLLPAVIDRKCICRNAARWRTGSIRELVYTIPRFCTNNVQYVNAPGAATATGRTWRVFGGFLYNGNGSVAIRLVYRATTCPTALGSRLWSRATQLAGIAWWKSGVGTVGSNPSQENDS